MSKHPLARLTVTLICAILLPTGTAPAQSQQQTEMQTQERVYGYELMTPQEREQHQPVRRTRHLTSAAGALTEPTTSFLRAR